MAASRITRSKPSNVGPISQRDLQDAFESVLGQQPSEEAAVMLLRLPSLGRIGPDSTDRQFVDMFILDGLRAKDVARIATLSDAPRNAAIEDPWTNPLGSLGQSVLSLDMMNRVDSFVQLANEAANGKNRTLAADIVSAFCSTAGLTVDFRGLTLKDASFSELDLTGLNIRNLSLEDCTFELLVLPNSPPSGVAISRSLVSKVSGASSFAGLPSWVRLESVDSFDSVQTVAAIRRAGLSPAHEILVAILKKTFRQKGAGRKEEALLRGFGSGAIRSIANDVISLLMREDLLGRHKGREGWVYTPNRSHSDRVMRLLDQLRSSSDELWKKTETLNK